MKTSKLIRGLTLSGFILLLAVFVAFRSGVLGPDASQAFMDLRFPGDTPPQKVDTVRVNPAMLGSSKSTLILKENLLFPIFDSVKKDSIIGWKTYQEIDSTATDTSGRRQSKDTAR